MDFNNSLFMMPLMVGTVFSIAGYITFKFPPKKINVLYGYRTKTSMKNQKCWNFAQLYSGKLMIFCGLSLVLASVLGLFFKVSTGKGVLISIILIITSVFVLIYNTEKAIKKQFKNEA